MKRPHLILAFLLFALSLPTQPVMGADPITVHIVMPPIASLDPVSLPRYDSGARDVAENLFVGLTRTDPASGQIQPMLAHDWTVSDDGLTWTFNLRNDVQWVRYNAASQQVEAVRPVVAGDFVYGIRRACDPQPPSPSTHTIYVIAGCRTIAIANTEQITDEFISRSLSVKATDDHTLTIKLVFPVPYFPTLVALPEFRPVPREAVEKDPNWTAAATILTDGPWTLTDWSQYQQMNLTRNPLWPEAFAGNVERTAITFAPTADATVQQITGGSADFARLDSSTVQAIRQVSPDLVSTGLAPAVTVLGFSTERPAVSKPEFRRALSLAIDRDSLARQIDLVQATSSFMPPGIPGGPNDPPDNRGYDPDGAKKALAAAGFPKCSLSVRLDFAVDELSMPLAQALVKQWQDVLGCNPYVFVIRKVLASDVEAAAHGTQSTVDPQDRPRPALWLYTWHPDYADANAWLGDALHCQFGFLRTGLDCGDAEPLIDAAATEKDASKRSEAYQKAESIWFGPDGSFPVAPLYLNLSAIAKQPTLTGPTVSGPERFDLWTLNDHP